MSCIKKAVRKHITKPDTGFGYGEPIKHKVGCIIPHVLKAQGAETIGGLTEYRYAFEEIPKDKPYKTRDEAGVKGAARELKKLKCNTSIEPHKNAFNEKANGYEILVMDGDKVSYDFAMNILQAFEEMFPTHKNRGIKTLSRGDRGYYNLRDAKRGGMKAAILTELFFIDCYQDFILPETMREFWERVLS